MQLVDATEAGIMLAGADGTLRYVASSSERMRLIELFELQHDEGPCVDAFRSGVAVHAVMSEDGERALAALRSSRAGSRFSVRVGTADATSFGGHRRPQPPLDRRPSL